MSTSPTLRVSRRWFRALLWLYPSDFRDEMGEAVVETYLDRCRSALERGGRVSLAGVWLSALADSLWNGPAERLRPAVSWRRSGDWGRDAQLVVRRLLRAPLFSLSVIGTLTVGLGAFAVVLTLVEKVIVEPLPYQRPGDLYFVWRDYSSFFDLKRGWLGGPDVTDLARAGGAIEGAVGLRRNRRTIAFVRDESAEPQEIGVMESSANLFTLLGVQPVVGRGFAPTEAGPDAPRVVVLSHDLWQQRFDGDSTVLGTPLRLNGELFTIIGVMGPNFHFVRHSSLGAPEGAAAYVTFPYDMGARDPRSGAFAGLIRARAGASRSQLQAAVGAVGAALDEREFGKQGLALYAVGVQEDLVAAVRPALLVLALSAIFLVLVLAANLGTLLLARAVGREREFSVSRALGADSVAIVRSMIVEAATLGALGGAGAAGLAVWGVRALVALAPLDLPRRETIAMDWRLGLAVTLIGVFLGVAAAVLPAVWASRSSLAAMLRTSAIRGGGGGRMRRSLVVVQVAVCLILLSSGGLVARSFEHLLRARPGFEPDSVLTFRIPIAQWRFPDNASAVAMQERIERSIAAIPGVDTVGAGSALPLGAGTDQSTIALPGAPGNTGVPEHDDVFVDVMQVRQGWFAALGTHILSGRDVGPVVARARREALIDRTLAAEFYPSGNPVGASAVINQDTVTIVGVVEHARQYDLHRDGRPQLYLRDADDTYGALSFAVRMHRTPLDVIPEVRAAIHRLDPQLAIADVRTLDAVVDDALREQRVSTALVSGFALGALLLAAMGLFGVVAGAVARRRNEIAVRLALGAHPHRVLRMLVQEGASLVALGILVAVPGVYLAGRTLQATLIGISAFDPSTLGGIAIATMVVALIACYVPARRAGAIEPAAVLREG